MFPNCNKQASYFFALHSSLLSTPSTTDPFHQMNQAAAEDVPAWLFKGDESWKKRWRLPIATR
jgi:hypothetical protein